MSLRTRDNIFTEVLVRNNRTTTDSFITDDMLKSWLVDAHVWAAAHRKWPFTEGRISTTYVAGSGSGSDEYYFEGYKSDSIRIMTIGGKILTKLNYEDYLILKEETPESTDRVYADFGRTVFINQKADVSGTLVVHLQYTPVIDPSVTTTETVFSGYDEEANEAIVEKMSAYMKRREHIFNEAELHDQRATLKLEEVWKRVQDEQYNYKTTTKRDGMFKRFDAVEGVYEDELFKRDQF